MKFRASIILCGVAVFLGTLPALGTPPVRFNYQAKLTDVGGSALNGLHTLYFTIFHGGDADTAHSGAPVYGESADLTLTNGVVSHTIGTGTPIAGSLDSNSFVYSGDIFLQVAVDSISNVVIPRSRFESVPFAMKALDAPASLFGQFGGSGGDGDHTVAGNEMLGGVFRREFSNLTVDAGTTLTIDQGWGFIGVSGICKINGCISAEGKGENGGSTTPPGSTGNPGTDASGQATGKTRVLFCVSGAGGGGGGDSSSGGAGGGAQAAGGNGGNTAANGLAASTFPTAGLILAGGVSSTAGSGKSLTSNFQPLLALRGAGGGGGSGGFSAGGTGGRGGGVIYIECNELVFTGTLTAAGANGEVLIFAGGGGGGGGGGGVVLVRARKITQNSGTVNVNGGAGGSGDFNGGNGGPGFWDVVEVR